MPGNCGAKEPGCPFRTWTSEREIDAASHQKVAFRKRSVLGKCEICGIFFVALPLDKIVGTLYSFYVWI